MELHVLLSFNTIYGMEMKANKTKGIVFLVPEIDLVESSAEKLRAFFANTCNHV